MAADPDGERNECRVVLQLVEQPRAVVSGPRLWVSDRQFCDLVQTARCSEAGDHLLIRYQKNVQFWPDPLRPAAVSQDGQARRVTEEWGWLGAESNRSRCYVQCVTCFCD